MLARHVQCYLLLGCRVVQMLMRMALGSCLIFMDEDFNITMAEKGALLSACALGYLFTQVPGGALADIIGGKPTIIISIGGSSICCLLVPFCAAFGVSAFYWNLALMGAFHGPLFPTCTVFLTAWIPVDERGWASTQIDTGTTIGSLAITPIALTLCQLIGWRQTYYLIGMLGLLFVAMWQWLAAQSPEECSWVTPEERSYLAKALPKQQTTSTATSTATATETSTATATATSTENCENALSKKGCSKNETMPLAWLLHPSLLVIFNAHMAYNYCNYSIANWSPQYYKDVLKISTDAVKVHLMVPYALNIAVKQCVNKRLNAYLKANNRSDVFSRKFFCVAGYLGFGGVIVFLPFVRGEGQSAWASTALFSLAQGCLALQPAGYQANYLDVSTKYAGFISGVGNTLGTVSSFFGPKVIAWSLERDKTWGMVWCSMLVVCVFAAGLFGMFASTARIEDRKLKSGKEK